jgi:hypothetical protein
LSLPSVVSTVKRDEKLVAYSASALRMLAPLADTLRPAWIAAMAQRHTANMLV